MSVKNEISSGKRSFDEEILGFSHISLVEDYNTFIHTQEGRKRATK